MQLGSTLVRVVLLTLILYIVFVFALLGIPLQSWSHVSPTDIDENGAYDNRVRGRMKLVDRFAEPVLGQGKEVKLNGQVIEPAVITSGPYFRFLNLLGNPVAGIDLSLGLSFDTEAGPILLEPDGVDSQHIIPKRAADSATIVYEDAYPDVDMAVVPTASGLIVLYRRKSDVSQEDFAWKIAGEAGASTEKYEVLQNERKIADEPGTRGPQLAALLKSAKRSLDGDRSDGSDVVAGFTPLTVDGEGAPYLQLVGDDLKVRVRDTGSWTGFSVDIPWWWQQPVQKLDGMRVKSGIDGETRVVLADGTLQYVSEPEPSSVSLENTGPAIRRYIAELVDDADVPNEAADDPEFGKALPFYHVPPKCVSDEGRRFRILYAHRYNEFDSGVRNLIHDTLTAVNGRLFSEAINEGGPMTFFPVVCDNSGSPRIDSYSVFPIGYGNLNSYDHLVSRARADGYIDPDVKWIIFSDQTLSGTCGTGSWSSDDIKSPINYNNRGNKYAVIYVNCWVQSSRPGRTTLHEASHMMGAVGRYAPRSSGAAHCNVGEDVMCYPDGGPTSTNPLTYKCALEEYDCNNQRYFHPLPSSNSYLETHWNIAGSENEFLHRCTSLWQC